MTRTIPKLNILLSLLLAFPILSHASSRHALVIGNSQYEESALVNPRNDAEDIAEALTNLGYLIYGGTPQLDLNLRQMKVAITDFSLKLPRNAVAVVYYAGHGASEPITRENYLIPIGASVRTEAQIQFEAVSLSYIIATLKDANSDGVNLLFIDACRNQPFGRSFQRSNHRGLIRPNVVRGSFVGFAAGEGQVASDGNGRNGLYTRYLLEAMRSTPNLQLEQVHKRVARSVYEASLANGSDQSPIYQSDLHSDICFGSCAGEFIPHRFVKIVGGCFLMGSAETEEGRDKDESQHRVCVDDVMAGTMETTVAQFRTFVEETEYITDAERNAWGRAGCRTYEEGDWSYRSNRSWRNPGFNQGDEEPVVCVTWSDAKAYTEWLSDKSLRTYRLPTEAEWEYAARGGSETSRYWGSEKTIACRYANIADETLNRVYNGWSSIDDCNDEAIHTSPVGSYLVNGNRLSDVLGNVWELTCSHYKAVFDGSELVCDNSLSVPHAARGGGWGNTLNWVRSANRGWRKPHTRSSSLGFRVFLDIK